MGKTAGKPARAKPRPASLRVSQGDAAALLGVSPDGFAKGYDRLFTDTRPSHRRGPGHRRWVLRDEIETYVESGEAALLDFRRRMGRLRGGK